MRWCFEGGSHDYADKILQQLIATGGTAFVPILWRGKRRPGARRDQGIVDDK
jgi:hypothetical protein